MGKKPKPAQPDENGMLNTGIYQHPVKAVRAGTPDDWQAQQDHSDYWDNCTFAGHLKRLRELLRPVIEPFVQYMGEPGETKADAQTLPGTYGCLNLGDGLKFYRQLPEIEEITPEANAARDAIVALHDIREIEASLERNTELAGKESHYVFMDALRVGMIMERINVRQFEPYVLSELGRRNRKRGTGAILTDEQWQTVQNYMTRHISPRLSAAQASEDVASQLRTGEFIDLPGVRVDIEAKTLANRYSQRNKKHPGF